MRIRPTGLAIAGAVLFATSAPAQAPASHLLSPDALSKVSEHVWMIKGFPNIGIVVGTRATMVIDTGMGTRNGRIVADAARKLSPQGQALYLTTTHYHPEHASGDGGFPAGTMVVRPRTQQAELETGGEAVMDLFRGRSAEDKALLADARIRPANILFDKETRIDLGGGVSARLMWFGAAHTAGDELIMVDPDSVLFSGDVVQNRTGPYFFCDACTPRSWIAVVDQAARLSPRIVVPDHSDPGDGRLIGEEASMLSFIETRAQALKAQGKSAAEAGETVTREFAEKYPGWASATRIGDAVTRAYGER